MTSRLAPGVLESIMKDAMGELAGPKRGEEIFEGTDYPHSFDGFVGQREAIEQIAIMLHSANARSARPEHMLIESGIAGVGKSTLATIAGFVSGRGFLTISGPLTAGEFQRLANTCEDGDIVFHDELHTLVAGNKNRADWVMPFFTEGRLLTERGPVPIPDVAFWGATTDAGKLPATLYSRFMCTPSIVPYTAEEAARICAELAGRMRVDVPDDAFGPIAKAADANPRAMRKVITAVRDLFYVYSDSHPNLEKAFRFAGVAEDGLSSKSQDILILLLGAPGYTMGLDTLRGTLGEPGPITLHEQQLLRHGLVTVAGRGRKLTDRGIERARQAARAA